MESFSASSNGQSFDFSGILQTSANIDNHDTHSSCKETLLFEPTFNSSNSTDLISNAIVITNMNSFYPEESPSYETLTNSNSLQVFDINSEINQPVFYNATNPSSKSYYISGENQISSSSWPYSMTNNYSSFSANENQKLTIMNNAIEYNSFPLNNEYQQISNSNMNSNQLTKATASVSCLTNDYNYLHPLNHSYPNHNQSSNEIQVNNSSLSSTSSSSSSTSSPSNNKQELAPTNPEIITQLKTEPLIFQSNENNLLTHFKSETNLQSFSNYHSNEYFNTQGIFKTEPNTNLTNKSNFKQTMPFKKKMSIGYSDNDSKPLFTSNQCNVCEKLMSSSSLGNETCEACKGFFRRFSRKLNSNQPPVCSQNCDVSKEKRNNCSLCRYEKCLAVGLSIENVYNDKSKLDEPNCFNCPTKVMKTEVDDDLNLNPNSINEMRNLSIEVVLSSTSSSSSNSFSSSSSSSSTSLSNSLSSQVSSQINDSFNYSDLIQSLFKEIDHKKSQIRLEIDEIKKKCHLVELIEKISQCLLNFLKRHKSKAIAHDFYSELISNRARSYLNDFNNENKQLIIAYQCLIDNQSNSFLLSNSFELRVKSLLDKIYSSINESSLLVSKYNLLKSKPENSNRAKSLLVTNEKQSLNSVSNLFDNNNNTHNSQFIEYALPVNSYESYYNNSQCYNFGITLTSNYSNLTAEEIQSNTLKMQSLKNQNGLAELKIYHFLLLLFSSFQNLDEFIKTGKESIVVKSGDEKSNESINNLNDCQKFIVKLIDRLCDDKNVKTKILLSVSEIEFF